MDERRKREEENSAAREKDMLDSLLHVEDENGRRLTDEEIIDLLVMYLNAGHESSGHVTMWATLLLQGHPEVFQKAKVYILTINLSTLMPSITNAIYI